MGNQSDLIQSESVASLRKQPQPPILMLAYGNPLRGDDGLAWRTADLLERKLSPVRILRLHQLTPEIAEDLSRCHAVIFIDAAATGSPGEIRVEELALGEKRPAEDLMCFHQFTPSTLMTMASRLYGARPRAFVATLSGQNFDHSESLSRAVEASIPEFVARIEALVRQIAPEIEGNADASVADATLPVARRGSESP
jgi:hydrogenase maturation protease